MIRRITIALLVSMPALSWADIEKPAAGALFAQSKAAGSVKLHEAADASSKALISAPNGTRLVYRKQMVGADGKPTWYFVTPPGKPAGWVQASELADRRPGEPPPVKVIPRMDSGLGVERPTAAQTAAARGLADSAKKYAATKEELKNAVDQFVTLEKAVEDYFKDPHNEADGSYPDITVEGRKAAARDFRAKLQ